MTDWWDSGKSIANDEKALTFHTAGTTLLLQVAESAEPTDYMGRKLYTQGLQHQTINCGVV
jgi:hypothetical protein